MTILEHLKAWLAQVRGEMPSYFPDDTSKNEGYAEAISDVVKKLEELENG